MEKIKTATYSSGLSFHPCLVFRQALTRTPCLLRHPVDSAKAGFEGRRPAHGVFYVQAGGWFMELTSASLIFIQLNNTFK